jgi:hypothetical protein
MTISITGGGESVSGSTMTRVDSTHYTFSRNVGAGNGTATVSLGGGKDVAGNTVTSTPTGGSTYTVDNVAPTAAITYSATGAVKSGTSLTITATFSEAIADSPVVKLAIAGAGETTAASNMTKVDSTHYTFTKTVGSGNGTATVSLSVGTDPAGNVVTSTPTSGATYTVDNTAPTTSSIVRVGAAARNAGPLSWTVTFSEPVSGVTASSFTLATSNVAGTAPSITSVTPTSTAPVTTWTVSVSTTGTTGANNGSIGLNKTSNTGVTDAAGNALTGGNVTGDTVTYDTTAPSLAITGMSSGGGNSKVTVSGSSANGAGSVTVYVCQTASCSAATAAETMSATPNGAGSWSATSSNNGTGSWWAVAVYSDAAGNTTTTAVFGPFTR